MIEKNKPEIINGWCAYDAGNSAYNLIITATIFPIYYYEVTTQNFSNGYISLANYTIKNTVLYNYTIAFAYFIAIIISPLLSAIADVGGLKKRFMQMFTYIGATSCILLFFFNGSNIYWGLTFIALAVIGYAASLVFYNSFLPLIATPEKHDTISARGFSYGYAGSVFLLIVILLFIQYSQLLNIEQHWAIRIAFVLVGIWWIVFAQIAFYHLNEISHGKVFNKTTLVKGYHELIQVFQKIRLRKELYSFLIAFFLLSIGVQTILLVATLFGKSELQIKGSQLIFVVLIIQIIAIIGALLFAKISNKFSNKVSLLLMLGIWIMICIYAWQISKVWHFFFLSFWVGLVMGGIQSQTRSAYAKMIPDYDTASYFSFYDITEKFAIVLGMFIFALFEHFTGNMRTSALILSIFFAIAFVILASIRYSAFSQKTIQK